MQRGDAGRAGQDRGDHREDPRLGVPGALRGRRRCAVRAHRLRRGRGGGRAPAGAGHRRLLPGHAHRRAVRGPAGRRAGEGLPPLARAPRARPGTEPAARRRRVEGGCGPGHHGRRADRGRDDAPRRRRAPGARAARRHAGRGPLGQGRRPGRRRPGAGVHRRRVGGRTAAAGLGPRRPGPEPRALHSPRRREPGAGRRAHRARPWAGRHRARVQRAGSAAGAAEAGAGDARTVTRAEAAPRRAAARAGPAAGAARHPGAGHRAPARHLHCPLRPGGGRAARGPGRAEDHRRLRPGRGPAQPRLGEGARRALPSARQGRAVVRGQPGMPGLPPGSLRGVREDRPRPRLRHAGVGTEAVPARLRRLSRHRLPAGRRGLPRRPGGATAERRLRELPWAGLDPRGRRHREVRAAAQARARACVSGATPPRTASTSTTRRTCPACSGRDTAPRPAPPHGVDPSGSPA